jgi:hypothetical protein
VHGVLTALLALAEGLLGLGDVHLHTRARPSALNAVSAGWAAATP